MGRVESLIGEAQDIRLELFLSNDKLSEIDRSCNTRGIAMVDSHAVDISVISNSPHILNLRNISKETHSLQPSISEHLVRSYHDLVLQKLIKNWSQHIHTSILPKSTLVI